MKRRELIKQMKKRGWNFFFTKADHLGFEHEDTGTKLTTSNTPSDHRSWKNFLARVKRIERGFNESPT